MKPDKETHKRAVKQNQDMLQTWDVIRDVSYDAAKSFNEGGSGQATIVVEYGGARVEKCGLNNDKIINALNEEITSDRWKGIFGKTTICPRGSEEDGWGHMALCDGKYADDGPYRDSTIVAVTVTYKPED